MADPKWPSRLTIVRHGQSAGNAALDAALAAGSPQIDLEVRDADVPLSEGGRQQARALAAWYRAAPAEHKPQILMASPFVRAVETARIIESTAGLPLECPLIVDERLREKEFGLLDGLTGPGIQQRFPEESALRARVGKFYYRPPGGESWCDVIFRLRSALDWLCIHFANRRVMIVAHQVIVLCMRYLLETLDERQILAIDREGDVANCSLTEYALDAGKLSLERYNFVIPIETAGAPVTAEPRANKDGA